MGVFCRVGQNRMYTPYMTVYLVISLPKLPYIHRIYMVLANPSLLRSPELYPLESQSFARSGKQLLSGLTFCEGHQ